MRTARRTRFDTHYATFAHHFIILLSLVDVYEVLFPKDASQQETIAQ